MKNTNPVERFVRWLLQPILRPREELARLYRERTSLTLRYQDACNEIARLQKEVQEDVHWQVRRAMPQVKCSSKEVTDPFDNVTRFTVRIEPAVFHVQSTSIELRDRGSHARRYIKERLAFEVAKELVKQWDRQKLFQK